MFPSQYLIGDSLILVDNILYRHLRLRRPTLSLCSVIIDSANAAIPTITWFIDDYKLFKGNWVSEDV